MQHMFDELRRVRDVVTRAVGALDVDCMEGATQRVLFDLLEDIKRPIAAAQAQYRAAYGDACALPAARSSVELPTGRDGRWLAVSVWEPGQPVIGQGLARDLAAGDAAAVGEGGDEEGVDERCAERGGQIDPLHFAARQSSRLPI